MSFADFRKYLKLHYKKSEDYFDLNILNKMKDYARVSLDAVKKKVNVNKRS